MKSIRAPHSTLPPGTLSELAEFFLVLIYSFMLPDDDSRGYPTRLATNTYGQEGQDTRSRTDQRVGEDNLILHTLRSSRSV